MPAPTNTTAGTATNIASLPASISQDVHDAGTTYEVWYKYIAGVTDKLIGLWGYGDGLTPYTVRTRAYSDAGITLLVDTGTGGVNKAIQVPVNYGTTYYFRFTPNAGNPTPAILKIEAEKAPSTAVINGDIFINDDTENFPGIVVDPSTGEVKNSFNSMPAGEGGDILEDGTILLADAWNGNLKLFDKNFNLLATIAIDIGFAISLRANHGQDLFYLGLATNPVTVKTVNNVGAIGGTTWTLTGNTNISGIAASNDGTTLYFANTPVASAVERWNLGTDTALSNLAAGIASEFVSDILVLDDDTIVVLSYLSTGASCTARRYNAVGTLLSTYSIGAISLPASTPPRLAYDTDLGDNFWVWTHRPSPNTGMSRFLKIKVSDGSILATVDIIEYETGVYNQTATLTPGARFGISFSCPFFLLRGYSSSAGLGSIIVGKLTDPYSPNVDFDFVAQSPLAPTSFTLQSDEEQLFEDLDPGTYSLQEVDNDDYFPEYLFSNNSTSPSAIAVAAGENVTVAVLNHLQTTFAGLYKIVRSKRQDTLVNQNQQLVDVKIPDPFIITAVIQDK